MFKKVRKWDIYDDGPRKSQDQMTLEEKLAKISRDYADKTSGVDLYFISKSEKKRLLSMTKGQKKKRRRRMMHLGIWNVDEEPTDKL